MNDEVAPITVRDESRITPDATQTVQIEPRVSDVRDIHCGDLIVERTCSEIDVTPRSDVQHFARWNLEEDLLADAGELMGKRSDLACVEVISIANVGVRLGSLVIAL